MFISKALLQKFMKITGEVTVKALWAGTWYNRDHGGGARRDLHGGRAGHRAAGATVFTFVVFGAIENGVQVHGSGSRQEG